MELLAKTNVGRDINRPYLSTKMVEEAVEKPVVKGLFELIKLRNHSNAFNGDFSVSYEESLLALNWENQGDSARLEIDFTTTDFNAVDAAIHIKDGEKTSTLKISELLG